MPLLPMVLAAVFLSIVINTVLKRKGIPTVIGYVVTGIAVTYFFHLHEHFDSLSHVAEFGIVFLMFTIGLEFSVKDLAAMKREVLLFGGLQLIITAIAAGAVAHALGVSPKGAIIIGLAIALSSTAVVLKSLNEKGEMHTPYGKKSVGILLFQDMAVIPILLMISIFASEKSDLVTMLEVIAADALMVLAILYLIGRYLLNPLLQWVTQTDSSEIFVATILFLVIGSAELAHLFGFTYSLGAFIAGMLLAETTFKYQIESELIPFRDLLMGLFFVTVGMQINLNYVTSHLGMIVLAATGIMLAKFVIIFAFLRFFSGIRTALKTALALGQIGEFAFAVFTLAMADGLLPSETVQLLFGATVISMIVSAFVLTHLGRIADMIYREPEQMPAVIESAGYRNHFVLCGYGPMGRNVAARLKEMGIPYVILEHDITSVRLGEAKGEPIFFANAGNPEILGAFGIERAAAVIIAVGNPHHLRLIAEAVKRVSDRVNVVIKAANSDEAAMIADLNIGHVVLQSEAMADLLVAQAMSCELI